MDNERNCSNARQTEMKLDPFYRTKWRDEFRTFVRIDQRTQTTDRDADVKTSRVFDVL